MKDRMLQTAWTATKLGATGGLIAAIAFAFGVFETDGNIQESDADILALGFAEASSREKFEDALDRLGHDEPRPFNMNGNVVYFSSAESRDDPHIVMERYQREFYEQGLNSEIFLDTDDKNQDKIILEGQTGGIIPMQVSENYILLGGMELVDKAEKPEDLRKIWKDHDPKKPWELYKAYRHIEIIKTERNTMIASSWSDNSFDYNKMFVGNDSEDQNVNADVPACIGCVRLNAFEDISGNQLYRSDSYAGRNSPADITGFYDKSLRQRGWEPTEASVVFDKVRQYADFAGEDAVFRRYAKGREFMTVIAYPDKQDDFSVVHAIRHE